MKKKAAAKRSPKVPVALSESDQNQIMSTLRQLFSQTYGEIPNDADLQALMVSMETPTPSDDLTDAEAQAKFEAQELAWEAMEVRSPAKARTMVKRALKLDPLCVDALLLLADMESGTPDQYIQALQHAVAAAEQSLGAAFIAESQGHFWMLIETRPYMRALETLARALIGANRRNEAIDIYEKMLTLNPNDNQGVRDPLLGQYLAVGDVAGAGRLLRRFKGDSSAAFAWGRVLERFLDDELDEASKALDKALSANSHVANLLLGRIKPPKELPEMYSPGSLEEAVFCYEFLGKAWLGHVEAGKWLMQQCVDRAFTHAGKLASPKKSRAKKAPEAQ